jgi:hypothetical protein
MWAIDGLLWAMDGLLWAMDGAMWAMDGRDKNQRQSWGAEPSAASRFLSWVIDGFCGR